MTTSDSQKDILSLLRKLWGHLTSRRRLQLFLLLWVMLATGLAELVSLGAVLPFLAVLTNPDKLWHQPLIQSLALTLGFSQSHQLVLPAVVTFTVAVVLAAVIRLLNLRLNSRLAAALGSDLSCESYRRTLYQPYQVHVQRNSSTLINAMTQHISLTVLALNAVLQIASASIVAAGLLVGLLLIDWQVAVVTAALFAIAYALVALSSRRQLRDNGKRIAAASSYRVQALQEGLGAIRDVLLDGTQSSYLDLYRRADQQQRQAEAKNLFLSIFPRYSLEALGLVVIAVLGGLLVLQRGSNSGVVPLLGALALGAQKLLPALQQIYSGWANLNGWSVSVDEVVQMLEQPLPQNQESAHPVLLKDRVCLHDVNFCYSSDQPDVLRGVNIEIRRGERIGLIGTTGSGKSTLVDLLMGLLPPSDGRLLVDGVDLYKPDNAALLVGWRSSVAHVPQGIYLADSSIAENIAFGVPKYRIDMSRVRSAAKQAQIAGFIENSTEGYASFVGERGIRLSGGQRQRIGIARALYKKASVIILDEATSALDNSTEEAVIEAVERLGRHLTMVMIAHRLSSVKSCDRIIQLDQGKIIASGRPDQLL